MRIVSLRYLLPIAALFIAACGDDSIRSPDLPLDRLVSGPTITCTPSGPLAVGETTQCAATACVYQSVDAEGNVTRDTSRACPTATWSVSNDNGTIDEGGLFTATKPGTVVVTGTIEGGSDDITITVSAACADSVADFTISPVNATTIAGSAPTTYRASLVLSDNSTVDVTAGTTWASSDNRVTFTGNVASTPADIDGDFTATITGSYNGSLLCDDVTGPATRSTSLTVTESTVVANGGICIGVIPPAVDFDGCRPDTGACVLPEAPIELAFTNPPQTRDLLIRARYTNGTECNVTNTATITSNNTGIATVSNGTVSGVGVGATTIAATFLGQTATPRPVTVTAGQVLGANSLKVFTKQPFTETEQITFARANNNKFACVGSNNLVADGLAGNPPRAGLLTYALAATCAADMLDEDGNCTAVPPIDPENPPEEPQVASAEGFDAIVRTRAANEVTNPQAPDSDLLADGIVWNSVAGFWNGPEEGCDTEAVDSSSHVGDAYIDPRTLAVGDDGTPVEPDPELDLPPGALQPNGVVYSVPGVRLGFSCVTATYTNPQDPTQTITDGMTVLVLPVINDVLLQSGADPGGDKLCDALSPLFGSGPLLGLVQTTPVLSAVTSSLAPLLEGLDAVPVDGLVTELQGGLSALTAPLIALLNGTLIPPLTDGLCVVTSGLGTLLGALTGNPNDPDCAQDPDAEEPAP